MHEAGREIVLRGIPASGGLALGRIAIQRAAHGGGRMPGAPAAEREALESAVTIAAAQLDALARERILLLDGAVGTQVQRLGLDEADFRGDAFAAHGRDLRGDTDVLCLTQPEAVASIHDSYLAAGADIVTTNTFNGTRVSQAEYDLADAVYELNVAAGKVLTEQGGSGHEAFVIVKGEAGVEVSGKQVAKLGPGAHFGELALLDGGPRTATVTALTDMTVLVISQRAFFSLLDEVPGLSRKILTTMAGIVRDLDERLSMTY